MSRLGPVDVHREEAASEGEGVSVAQSLAQLNSARLESSVRIAVVGASGSGKTVFLTCLFQTIQERIPIVSKDDGGYFEQRESEIRRSGACRPTESPVLSRFEIETTPETAQGRERLPVYLLDFPGRLFSDPQSWGPGRPTDDPLFGAEDFLVDCDAYILLINSSYFASDNPAPAENPFPRGVDSIVRHCSSRGTPLALVFTQRDRNPSLTMRQVNDFPVVQRFKGLFSSDPASARQGGRPFGFVRLLTCYEGSPGQPPRRRNTAGGIWATAAAKTFEAVFRAAWPEVQDRLTPAADPPSTPQPRRPRRSRRAATLSLLVILSALGAAAFFLWGNGYFDRRFIGQALHGSRQGQEADLTRDQRDRLHRLLEERSIPELEAILDDQNTSDSQFFDTEMRLLMAGWLMEAAARREEALIRSAADELLTAAQPQGPRRLDDLVRQFRQAASVEENRKLLGGLGRLSGRLDELAPLRRKAARLLDGLSEQRSTRAWRHILQALKRNYLFDLNRPEGADDPSVAALEAVEKAEAPSLKVQAVERLIQRPVYHAEIAVLTSWVRFRDLALRTVRLTRSGQDVSGDGEPQAALRREVGRYRQEAPNPSLEKAFADLEGLFRGTPSAGAVIERACRLLDLDRGDCG